MRAFDQIKISDYTENINNKTYLRNGVHLLPFTLGLFFPYICKRKKNLVKIKAKRKQHFQEEEIISAKFLWV